MGPPAHSQAANSCRDMACAGFVLTFSQRLHSSPQSWSKAWWWMVQPLQPLPLLGPFCWYLGKGKQRWICWVQKGWHKQQFTGSIFPMLWRTGWYFISIVGWDPLLAIGYKVALEILHSEQSLSEGRFPRKNFQKGNGKGLTSKVFSLFNKQETLNKSGNCPFKFDTLASSRVPSFREEAIGSEIKWAWSWGIRGLRIQALLAGVQFAHWWARQFLVQEFLCKRPFALAAEEISCVTPQALFCQ